MAEQSAAVHRRARTGYTVAAVVLFAGGALTRWLWPSVAAFTFGAGATWVWAVVGVAYHHGWLRRGQDIVGQCFDRPEAPFSTTLTCTLPYGHRGAHSDGTAHWQIRDETSG